MIQPHLEKHALKAIESMVSLARFKALQGCEPDVLAEILDGISYLPQILLDDNERTSDFVKCLTQLLNNVPESQIVLSEFCAQIV